MQGNTIRCMAGTLATAVLALALPTAASADECLADRTKALAKVTAGYVLCESKAAKNGDGDGIEVCRDKAREKFIKKWDKGEDCGPVQTICESSAYACENAVAAAITGTLPDKCVAAKRKAAAKFAKGVLACLAESAKTGRPSDEECPTKAAAKLSKALTKAGDCTDGGSVASMVFDNCVVPPVDIDGEGIVTGVCMPPETTTTLPPTTTTIAETCGATDAAVCLQYRDSSACYDCCQKSGSCGPGNCQDGAILYSCSLLATQCRNDIDAAGCTAECCP